MRKHLIIDGYNLLGRRGKLGRGGAGEPQLAREQLLRDLSAYRQRKDYAITVVFDGWQHGSAVEHHEHRAGVQVVYSRRGERADQLIQRLAAEYGGDCAVVSSDREVADSARVSGAFVMDADEFDAKLRTGNVTAASPGGGQYAARVGKDNVADDLPGQHRPKEKKGNPKKLPKAVRKRMRQLKSF